jgi:cytochrome c oxidase subunit 2
VTTAVVVGVLPVLAQEGEPCSTCPVSFDTTSILDPGSKGAQEISQLFYIVVGIAAVVFVGVEGLLLFSIVRFRNRPVSEAIQVHGNTKLELAWTIVPAIILVVLLGFTLRTMASVRAPVEGQAVRVTVIGHQWWWEFRYPDLGITTANQLIVPVGTPIEVELQSDNVLHGFWAPQLFGKMDAVPGHLNRMNFTVSEPGAYGAQCTQMCGIQHAMMRFQIVAVTPAEFGDWQFSQTIDAAAPADEAATRGLNLFLSKGCAACHSIQGTQALGAIGPNLTHLGSRHFIAGGVLSLSTDNLTRWVQDAPGVKPGVNMPSFRCLPDGSNQLTCLAPDEVGDIVTYLGTLR